jgi:hypothetical protein
VTRYWLSWIQPTEDYRPKTYPPNKDVLGWWCSGYDSEDNAILCACVAAKTETKAKSVIKKDWPEAKQWRFCDPQTADFRPGDRFPIAGWMTERFKLERRAASPEQEKRK